MTVREARAEYYRVIGIPEDGGASQWVGRADFGPLTLYVPNFSARVAALQRHDLHHILLGADTSMRGEARVAGFETGAGCGRFWVAWFLEPQALAWGLFLNPRETFRSFRLGRRSSSLYHGEFSSDWLDLSVDDLRARVLNTGPGRSGDIAWFVLFSCLGLIGLLVSIFSLLAPFLILWIVLR